MNLKESKKIANSFVNQFSDTILKKVMKRFEKIRYGNDVMPFLRFFEFVFEVKNKGINVSLKHVQNWKKTFQKCETLVTKSKNIDIFPQIVLHETLAHRYSDYYRITGKYEDKFNEHYSFSYNNAKKNNFGLHIDGSAFWNGVAYERCGKINEASKYFLFVIQNRLEYVDVRMPILKVQSSFDFFIKYPQFVPNFMMNAVIALEKQNVEYGRFLKTGNPIQQSVIDNYKHVFR